MYKTCRLTTLLVAMLLFTGVSYAQKTLTVTGKLDNNIDFEAVVLEDIVYGKELARTVIGEDGSFRLETKILDTDFYKLSFTENSYLLLVLKPGDQLSLKIDANDVLAPEISGSPDTKVFYDGINKLNEYDEKQAELDSIYTANYDSPDIETIAMGLIAEYQEIEEKKTEFLVAYIIDNKKSLASLFFIEKLEIDDHISVYKELIDALKSNYPTNQLVVDLDEKYKSAAKTAIGQLAPEIDLPTPDGESIKLSSLQGEYVLIDFWAAWCRPCRAESPNMVRMYNKFKDKGFTIYSVSLDQTKAAWVKAIEDDGLSAWSHVSDLKYWDSEASRLYGVQGIPYTVLIDREGKIVAKNLRGDALEEKLDEIFN